MVFSLAVPPCLPLSSPPLPLQYTNLKFQAASNGLGKEWDRICTSYAAANRALGDIVKVGDWRGRGGLGDGRGASL